MVNSIWIVWAFAAGLAIGVPVGAHAGRLQGRQCVEVGTP